MKDERLLHENDCNKDPGGKSSSLHKLDFHGYSFFMFFFLPCHLIRPLWSEKLVGSSVGSSVIGNPIARSIGTATGHAGSSEFLVPMDQHASWRIWCVFLDHPCDQRFS